MKIGKNAHDIFAPTVNTSLPEAKILPANEPVVEPVTEATPKVSVEVERKQTRTKTPPKPAAAPPAVITTVIEPSPGRGRPQLHQEPATKITTVLLNRHVVYLDGLSNEIRQQSGAVVKRSEILRALVEALENAKPDLGQVRSQDDLTELLRQRLK